MFMSVMRRVKVLTRTEHYLKRWNKKGINYQIEKDVQV